MQEWCPQELKSLVVTEARRIGMEIVRSCPVSRWDEYPLQSEEYRPRNILPWAENAIVMAVPLFVPMLATSPSMVYQELYNTTNRILDDAAYRMSLFLTRLGYRAMFFPRDGYSSIDALLKDPTAAFSQVLAAYYSGMGTIGDSHNLITKEFGPRVRMVTVVTDAPVEADPMLKDDLCVHCGRCLKDCPAHAFTDDGRRPYGMDYDACTEHHIELKRSGHWPCGTCIKVCPVGDDMKAWRGTEPVSRSGAEHCGRKGSRSLSPSALQAELLSFRNAGVALLAIQGPGTFGAHPSEHRDQNEVRYHQQPEDQEDVEDGGEQPALRRVQIERRIERYPEHA